MEKGGRAHSGIQIQIQLATDTGRENVVIAKLGETKTMPTGEGQQGQKQAITDTRGGKLQTDCNFIFCLRGRKIAGKPLV